MLYIFCLIEPKVKMDKAPFNFYSRYFDKVFCCYRVGRSGGLCLCWNSSTILINVISSYSWLIHCEVKETSNDLVHFISFVYGYPKKHLQNILWEEILSFNPGLNP